MSKEEVGERLRKEAKEIERKLQARPCLEDYHRLLSQLDAKYEVLNTFFVEPLEPSEERWALH